ncbi:hypothetical protein ACIA5G_32770 [Amycolatopsis sp. NPDC051758]|uniref:hypothetical protein n=1 Tax=Amycolatopsis sp. NPDC051758 TaxID=3363935 RepID=UPI0037A4D38E
MSSAKSREGSRDVRATPTEVKVDLLRRNLEQSGWLTTEIEAEFQLQIIALERIKAEADENQKLAALHQDEADAVRAVIESAQVKGERPVKRQQWLFFLAGLFFSIPLGVGVNFLYDLITH